MFPAERDEPFSLFHEHKVMSESRYFRRRYLTANKVRKSKYSTSSVVYYGVPQGRVLGPILFLLHTADVPVIAGRHGVGVHSYADDTQLFLHTRAEN